MTTFERVVFPDETAYVPGNKAGRAWLALARGIQALPDNEETVGLWDTASELLEAIGGRWGEEPKVEDGLWLVRGRCGAWSIVRVGDGDVVAVRHDLTDDDVAAARAGAGLHVDDGALAESVPMRELGDWDRLERIVDREKGGGAVRPAWAAADRRCKLARGLVHGIELVCSDLEAAEVPCGPDRRLPDGASPLDTGRLQRAEESLAMARAAAWAMAEELEEGFLEEVGGGEGSD